MELKEFVTDFASALARVDASRPQALNARSGAPYQPGIGPHTEPRTVELVISNIKATKPESYIRAAHLAIPYGSSRDKCDICIGEPPGWEWAIEVKMIRMLGDNGKPNDNLIAHILSPYPSQRSALTDCTKLVQSQLHGRKAILVYGYDYPEFPLDPLIAAFELLAADRVRIRNRTEASFGGLIHPVHTQGRVCAWEIDAAVAAESGVSLL
ncbi:MAG: hypothetical protein WED83_00440 [Acidimicrobiia bacterium]